MEKIILTLGLVALLSGAAYLLNEKPADVKLAGINSEVVELFTWWKAANGKKYGSLDQDFYRLTVFNENYQIIKAFYEGPEQTYELGYTQFMDITQEEFINTYLGTNVEYPRQNVEETVELSMSAPLQAVDWRTRGVLNPIRNQGSCGSCWAFSAVGAIESGLAVAGKGLASLSEQELVDCSTSYGNGGCNGGWMDSAFQYVMAKGISAASAYPYVAKDQKCQRQNGTYRISGFTDVAAGNCASLETALAGKPIAVAVDASNWSLYSSGVFNNCATGLNHGVVLVAADASQWTIRNSWSSGWGEAGHIRLAKGNTCGVCQAASYIKA